MIPLVLVLLGLCFGSFVNALVWRLHEGRNWVNERSECTHCHHQLAAKDLVPVLSWIALRGHCRYCGKRIEDTPITELSLPVVFIISYYAWPASFAGVGLLHFVLWLVFLVGFAALALYDARWFLLPDKIVFSLMALAAVWTIGPLFLGGTIQDLFGSILGAAIISGFFFGLYVLSKGQWIGFGDVKLGIMLGLIAGSPIRACLVLFVASLLGVLISLPLLMAHKVTRKSHLPFGPLLIAGLIVAVLFGQGIIDTYMRLLLPG